jgi:hypothetical protein
MPAGERSSRPLQLSRLSNLVPLTDKEVLMRRGSYYLFAAAALAWLTPSVNAQYPYPYGPPVYAPMPPYGYPAPMVRPPMYAPPPMMPPPGYYYPPPMMQRPPVYLPPDIVGPPVYSYGPLQPETRIPLVAPAPAPPPPAKQAATATAIPTRLPPRDTVIKTTQAVTDGCATGGCLPNVAAPGACATGTCLPNACDTGVCGDACNGCPPPHAPAPHPLGHWIGMVGVNFLVPRPDSRLAYTTNGATTNFPDQVMYAPYFSLGYITHSGWGVRSDFWYTHSNSTVTATNNDPTTAVATAGTPPFQLASPGPALQLGIGADQFNIVRSFDFKVGDLEVVKECSVFDLFFLLGGGVRYANITQKYSALRTNGGGFDPTGTSFVAIDRETLFMQSRFQGAGPTFCVELVHPIHNSCVSFYGTLRSSVLFGTDQFQQLHTSQTVATTAGVTTVTAPPADVSETDRHVSTYSLEAETGLQIGRRCGHCYVFGRVGALYSRWWDIGTPVSSTGSMDIYGGTLKLGIVY